MTQQERDGGADPVLALEQPPSGFALAGTVDGNCIEFTTTEQTAQGQVRYEFTGTAEGDSRVSGTFTSTGPGTCSATGSFLVEVQ